MHIVVRFIQAKSKVKLRDFIKNKAAILWIEQLQTRLGSKFKICAGPANFKKRIFPEQLWICDRRGQQQSSEDLSKKIQNMEQRAYTNLEIYIGNADGFSAEEIKKADFLWGFGPQVMSHELAATVLLEQLYRVECIKTNHPYHCKH